MPTFTFTSPEGKTYDITGPEGSTKEQAFQKLQQQLGSQKAKEPAAKPVSGVEAIPGATQDHQPIPGVEGAKAIASSTGLGAVLGAASPEIVSGVGAAMGFIPGLQPAAPYVFGIGRAMRVERTAMALAGAVSGAVSETAGQATEALGGSEETANKVRFAAGLGSPLVGPVAKAIIAPFVPKAAKTAWGAVQALAGQEGKATAAAIAQAKGKLSSDALSTAPQLDLHVALKQGVDADIKAADMAAGKVLSDAHAQAAKIAATDGKAAEQLITEAKQKAEALRNQAAVRAAVLDKATAGQLERAERVSKQAEGALHKIGQPQEVSDIGKSIRGKVTAEQNAALQARDQQFQALKTQRDAVVQQKEASGKFVDQEPAMKELKEELSRKLLNTKSGRAAAQGKAEATESGVVGAYQKVYDAVANRRVQTGVNADGNPTYETFKTSFDALDHVRRKLGQVAKGEAEGYEALGKGIANDLYHKISKIQKDYVGGDLQSRLQGVYREGSGSLTKFETATGKKLTAVDRVDPEVFSKDPAAIPGAYFKSQQGVKDLLELTGEPGLVHQAAESYTARQLAGRNAKQVQDWASNPQQTDWMREVPGLQQKVKAYATELERIEKYEASAQGRVKAVQDAKGKMLGGLKGEQEKVMARAYDSAGKMAEESAKARGVAIADGTKAAAALKESAEKQAKSVIAGGAAPADVRKLLTDTDVNGLRYAAKYISGSPGGQKALEGSVRNILAQESPQGIQKLWNERLHVVMKETHMLPPKVLEKLDADVQRVLRSGVPPDEKKKTIGKIVAGAIATGGRGGAAAVTDAVTGRKSRDEG